MSKHHSTISRRDFLKILGLGGVGLGAAAVAAPVFHDLDEVIASPQAEFKRPWYVKEVDKPTVEVDWNMYTRWDYRESMWQDGMQKAWGPTKTGWIFKMYSANLMKWLKENRPGWTLRDYALAMSKSVSIPLSFLGPRTTKTPEELGVPRWEGTPEENARMIRAYLRANGCSQVGFVELDTNTTEKLIYSNDSTPDYGIKFKRNVIADVDQPSETDEERIIPKKARWVIVYTLRLSDEQIERMPTLIGASTIGYTLALVKQAQLQNFLRTLGYMGLGESTRYHEFASVTGLGVMAGLGETCRVMHLMSPEYGLKQRLFKLITDLPLAPGKPIDFGAMQFCRTCKKCADFCPPKAIPNDTEPSWENTVPYHSQGIRMWRRNEPLCIAYMYEATAASCGICLAVCPLTKGNRQAFYHDIMRATISTTPVFNRFFRKMDDFLGYGMKTGEDIEKFWELDLPPFGWE